MKQIRKYSTLFGSKGLMYAFENTILLSSFSEETYKCNFRVIRIIQPFSCHLGCNSEASYQTKTGDAAVN